MPASKEGFWTEARVEQLKVLHAQGLSSSQIATTMRAKSRNAVIGRLHRMGISRGPDHALTMMRASSVRRAADQRARFEREATRDLRSPPKPKPKPVPGRKPGQIPTAEPVFDATDSIAFCDRREGRHCVWPINPFSEPGHMHMAVCGAPVAPDERSYCAHHVAKSKAPSQPKPMSKWNPDAPVSRRRAA